MSKIKKRTVVAVLSANTGIYTQFYNKSSSTWAKDLDENTEAFFYFGKGKPWKDKPENVIECDVREGMNYSILIDKTVFAFKYILDHFDFEYIIRPCAASYIDTHILDKMLIDMPKEKFYFGPDGLLNGIRYVSGSAIIMSRDLVESIVANSDKLRRDLIDDVSIGEYITEQLNIPLFVSESKKYTDLRKTYMKPASLLTKDEIEQIKKREFYHYHFVSRVGYMEFIHNIITGER